MSPAEFPDSLALARDELLLDALSLRREPQGASGEEEIGRLLAAFAAEIDEGIDEVISAGLSADVLDGAARGTDETAEPDSNVVRLPVGRRGMVRGLAAGLVVAGVVSVSGVAAAVTGDPFAPYKRVIAAVSGHGSNASPATVAQLNRSLTGVRAAIARGDLDSAQSSLDEMNGQLDGLSGHDRLVMEKRIAALEASLDAATGKAKGKDGSTGAGASQPSTRATHDPGGPSGGPTREPSPKPTKEPKAKPQPTGQSDKPGGDPTAQPTPTSTAAAENGQGSGDNGQQRTAQQAGAGSTDRAKHS
jgi:hypothetical protein